MEKDPKIVGDLIKKYRKMSQEELGALLGKDQTYVSKLESGTIPIPVEIARKLDSIFLFEPEDREVFYAETGLIDFVEAIKDYEVQQRMDEAVYELRRKPLFRELLDSADYVPKWLSARGLHLRFNISLALPRYEEVEIQARGDTREGMLGELSAIILLDLADAYILAGQLGDARDRAKQAERISRDMLRSFTETHRENAESSEELQRMKMGVGRALVMRQQEAYLRGCEAECCTLHEEALKFLSQADDYYGLAKSLYLLSLLRFHQGRLTEAERYAGEAYEKARAIKSRLDPWWWMRDGLFISDHWWRLHTLSLLLDVLTCTENSRVSKRFAVLKRRRKLERVIAFWAHDFPPFSQRYWWVGEARTGRLSSIEKRFCRWFRDAKRLNVVFYQVDILISWGDFLTAIRREQEGMQKYREAQELAVNCGFDVLRSAAERRITGEGSLLTLPGS